MDANNSISRSKRNNHRNCTSILSSKEQVKNTMIKQLKKKAQASFGLNSLLPLGITFLVLAIAMGLGASVLSDIQTDQVTGAAGCNSTVTSACGVDYNSTGFGLQSVNTITKWMPTIALVVVSAIIIGIVLVFLAVRARR